MRCCGLCSSVSCLRRGLGILSLTAKRGSGSAGNLPDRADDSLDVDRAFIDVFMSCGRRNIATGEMNSKPCGSRDMHGVRFSRGGDGDV